MKIFTTLLLLSLLGLSAQDKLGSLVFEDQFERSESTEDKEEPGNGWITNSQSRAKGNKQIDLKNGAMHISTHPEADHAAVAKHDFKFQNGTIQHQVNN
jgi:hypothetical protein